MHPIFLLDALQLHKPGLQYRNEKSTEALREGCKASPKFVAATAQGILSDVNCSCCDGFARDNHVRELKRSTTRPSAKRERNHLRILYAKQREWIICSPEKAFRTPSSFCKQRHSEHFHVFGATTWICSESCSLMLTSAKTLTIVLAELGRLGGRKPKLETSNTVVNLQWLLLNA